MTIGTPSRTWDDDRLVAACLAGDEQAWSALIDKYKNLVYSVPRKYRMSPDDAADVFQSVCVDLYNELPKLRSVASLRAWLLTVASHHAFHWKRRYVKRSEREGTPLDEDTDVAAAPPEADVLETVQREQSIREAVAQLTPRCQEMIRLLFFTQPPIAYADLARHLNLAVGSIGFIRGRCLQKLQKLLGDVIR
ncbi:MAG: sigma-70 family RNA polymerase sigma factor [Acidobacteria bacterium]|nr:sigma-70 family RNA polymerase sigma factor [Acidobacteriota bacterium]